VADESPKDKLGGIVPSGSGAIAKSSASLMGRGLRSLSGWDAARVIEIGKKLTSHQDPELILRTIKEKVEEFLNPPIWSLLLVDGFHDIERPHEDAELYYAIACGTTIPEGHRIKIGDGFIGHIAKSNSSVVITDVQTNAAILAQVQEPQEKRAESIVAVPLRFEGEYIGVIELIDCVGLGGFSQADLSLLEALADFVAIALWNAAYLGWADILISTDEQTGLYNARYLDNWLDSERRGYEASLEANKRDDDFIYIYTFSLVCVVSDELKNLAASLSYAQYIQLLGAVGRGIKDSCPNYNPHGVAVSEPYTLKDCHTANETLAFYCGEGKFYLTLSEHSKEQASVIASIIHKFFRDTVWLQDQGLNVRLTASIGVATCPEDGRTEAELLHSAEEAMNLVRKSTGDGVAATKIGILPPL